MWLFGSSDTRKAKQLVRLADQTIALMQEILSNLPTNDPNRRMVEAHLERRRKSRDRYSMLARGESDDSERLMPTLSNFDIWRGSMEGDALPPGEWSGLFFHYVPGQDRPLVVFGREPEFNESQKRFMARFGNV